MLDSVYPNICPLPPPSMYCLVYQSITLHNYINISIHGSIQLYTYISIIHISYHCYWESGGKEEPRNKEDNQAQAGENDGTLARLATKSDHSSEEDREHDQRE